MSHRFESLDDLIDHLHVEHGEERDQLERAELSDLLDAHEYWHACEGHPAGPFDALGETAYCDGSCKP